MKFYEHPSTHGHHINTGTCGSRLHGACSGFSGGHDTYICGCCCHDAPGDLTEEQRRIVARVRGEVPAPTDHTEES